MDAFILEETLYWWLHPIKRVQTVQGMDAWDGYHWKLARQMAQDENWVSLKAYMDTLGKTYLRESMEYLVQSASPLLYHEYWTAWPAEEKEEEEDWDSISSRVTGPQSFDQMVWPYSWGCVGLERSHGRRGTGQTRVGFVDQRFPSSQHPPGKFSKTINRHAHYIVAFKNPRDQTGIRTILMQAFPDRWRQVLGLFKRITSRPFGYLMLDVHPASDDRYRLWSHLTPREGQAQVHTLPVDVPAVRKRAASRTRTSTQAKRRRKTH